MTKYALSILETHFRALRELLFAHAGNERAAYVELARARFGSSTESGEQDQMLLSHSVVAVPDSAIVNSTPWQITWTTADVIRRFKAASERNFVLAIVHNHGENGEFFSDTDNENESMLVRTIQNRNGPDANLVSIVLTPNLGWIARIWTSPHEFSEISDLRILGSQFQYMSKKSREVISGEYFDRQKLLFGSKVNELIRNLHVCVVGCGGTGSAVATLLGRLGFGKITLVDSDVVDRTNLNRLHGSTLQDAVGRRNKVDVVAEHIRMFGSESEVVACAAWVSDAAVRSELLSSHVIFGCTDDNAGRMFINRIAYYYQIPVFDLGLSIEVGDTKVTALDGRLTVLLPGDACLLCREIVNPVLAREEELKRHLPEQYESQRKEAYVIGAGDPRPAVVTFTTELACLAVNELIHRLTGFRGSEESVPNRVRLFHRMVDLRASRKPDPECRICGTESVRCRGDREPFLDIVS
jgi:molybdopterin/thiamine biosynthesis adenylyltransferase